MFELRNSISPDRALRSRFESAVFARAVFVAREVVVVVMVVMPVVVDP